VLFIHTTREDMVSHIQQFTFILNIVHFRIRVLASQVLPVEFYEDDHGIVLEDDKEKAQASMKWTKQAYLLMQCVIEMDPVWIGEVAPEPSDEIIERLYNFMLEIDIETIRERFQKYLGEVALTQAQRDWFAYMYPYLNHASALEQNLKLDLDFAVDVMTLSFE